MRIDFKISMEHFHTSMNVSVDPFFRIISSGQSYNKVEANGGFLMFTPFIPYMVITEQTLPVQAEGGLS